MHPVPQAPYLSSPSPLFPNRGWCWQRPLRIFCPFFSAPLRAASSRRCHRPFLSIRFKKRCCNNPLLLGVVEAILPEPHSPAIPPVILRVFTPPS
ncbi:uncharacterized protein TEOVI_000225500 [Trypanosoma equiperdum]|uniref:Uncharacterized protein n=4 Tax=Trypanozoon TaxID=39700 RepID=Q4GYL4_TRYB2|nr:hypothetical protein, unlikely [Trypanosoma brucei brucei TREU927]XP_011771504.1 hypothetical protein, unlikely [Trypanosoma brucei gambiense DAL972]RHW74300.1 hypothetical protein DPX39_010036100 [Trypanosoma brucei equiperdum]SCU70681.1 hypothetical protein, conserved [Trypanosoma equiperdum]CAJ16570.1 hypothetical protein, unlikely [Trypanosoma brucei brucei TREU927]CBH09063.1 hypothetical protein, unlikely [Trypanosoma brucei gambiense DAL972]|eukprot:XP_011771504.1 hypothetical protein, unlikely [Trypanosoma brucei gambiense DAL972]